jgi:hypothetical protein
MKRLIRLFFILIFCAGCNNVPEGIIHEDDMISLLTDMHLVDGYTSMLRQDSVHLASSYQLYNSVFNKYHTDSAEFRKSLEYYSKKPEEFFDMYKEVQENLDSLNSEQVRRFEEKARAKK